MGKATKFVLISACGFLICCEPIPKANIASEEALQLLNEGKVRSIGVSHFGWVGISTFEGNDFLIRVEDFGYPSELLKSCSKCKNTSMWIE